MSWKRIPGFRLVPTRLGDTLQAIAAREMGDASKWVEIAALNGLAPPYVVDSLLAVQAEGFTPTGGLGRVHLAGTRIRIPSAMPRGGVSDPEDVYGTDIELPRDGRLAAGPDGDLALVRDVPNLTQALRIRLETRVGELIRHADYGDPIFELLGGKGNSVTDQLGAAYAEQTLRKDPRVADVQDATAEIAGDAMTVTAEAVAIAGRALPVGAGRPDGGI
jgi:phage baseplate assembly protein W